MAPLLRGTPTPRRSALAWSLVASVGVLAAGLVAWGNPGNMGVCGACFLRDWAGSLGLFSGAGPKIARPEVLGVILGAFAWRLGRRSFEGRSGSHAITRLVFGAWMGVGALVFLGCPFRMLQRLGGGDGQALFGLAGFVVGVSVGVAFERRGYGLGKTSVVPAAVGLFAPLLAVLALVGFLLTDRLLGPGPGAVSGPAHAHWALALGVSGVVGIVLSATGFCAVSGARQLFGKDRRMLIATGLLVAAYAVTSMVTGRFEASFEGQPAAHQDAMWSMVSMVLVGLTGCLVGGCPVRQLVMAGEGNGDATVTVAGILGGGALAHTLGLASSGAGTTEAGRIAVVLGLAFALAYATSITRAARRA